MLKTAELAIIGQLKTDPEIAEMRDGKPFVVLALMVPNLAKVDGQVADSWLRTTAFGAVAEYARTKLRRGDLVFARGKPTLDRWSDRITGEQKAGLSLIAEELVRIGVDMTPQAAAPARPPVKPQIATPTAVTQNSGETVRRDRRTGTIQTEDSLPKLTKTHSAVRPKPDPRWQEPLEWERTGGDRLDDIFTG